MKITENIITTIAYKMPTRVQIIDYYKRNGYPNPNKFQIEDFILPNNRIQQFYECIAEDYELCDFDRWQHFEDVIKSEIPYSDFLKIMNILWENDIEILEI